MKQVFFSMHEKEIVLSALHIVAVFERAGVVKVVTTNGSYDVDNSYADVVKRIRTATRYH